MNSLIATLLAFAVAAFAFPAQAATPTEAFARLPKIADGAISPDGKHFALKEEKDGIYVVAIRQFDTGAVTCAVGTKKSEVRWMKWANNGRLLVSLGFNARRGGTPTVETRLMGVDIDCGNKLEMVKENSSNSGPYGGRAGPYESQDYILQIQDDVVDLLPNDPKYILMAFNTENPLQPRVQKVNVDSANYTTVERGLEDGRGWISDQQGNVRAANRFKDGKLEIKVRRTADSSWETVRSFTESLEAESFVPVGFKADPNIMYVLSSHEGGGRGLYEYNLQANNFAKRVFKIPSGDVEGINRNDDGTKIESIYYAEGGATKVHWVDPAAKQASDILKQALPGKTTAIISASRNYGRLLIGIKESSGLWTYALYDRAQNRVLGLGTNYPELSQSQMGKTVSFDFKARDGLTIPALLTLPPGHSSAQSAKNLPLVVFPHGGPISRDESGFDPYTQFLAHRGYAVLQVNFRGSTGYGQAFVEKGRGEWGRKTQDDISDGTKHAISQGVADAGKVCIIGISFGGYSSLMGPIREPGLYKCAASINGVTDLKGHLDDQRFYVRRGFGYNYLGNRWSDRDLLDDASPQKRAQEIGVPVLLVHTKDDRTVRFAHSSNMQSALQSAGVPHKFVPLDFGDHSITNSVSRMTLFKELESFLKQHIG